MSVHQTSSIAWERTHIEGILSKNLIEYPEGTVKLVLLESGSAYPEHQHPDRTEYVYVLEGSVVLSVGESEYTCQIGDCIIIPVNERHALHNQTDKRTVLLIGAIFHQKDESEITKQRVRQENLKNIIREIIQEELQSFYQKIEDLITFDNTKK
ncbi:hypothetical protein DNHGIG_19860 [Collibacillus ludicampi]|uniref:Cupin type-2 domain-containing protein n=1 Tax=Collibacillus ludicampi TaxID=2771369 RepID=A0AAV4LG41_9BACL|nr:cupin domain-containing protein [Collibacillus ludicampi]GIM46437.1 hypothetical protein DNHGIG_19860 [Collibacillus ludicampi]